MHYLVGLILVLALGVMGCGSSEVPLTACPAEAPWGERCSGDLVCPYGSTTCCCERRPYLWFVCEQGAFVHYVDDCLPGGCEPCGGAGGDGGSGGIGGGGAGGG